MNIVFMGTPVFAAKSLQRLMDDGHNILAAFTQPDKPKNRGMKPEVSPVKKLAEANGIAVRQPITLKDADITAELTKLAPELIAVVAYGKLLPTAILQIPQYGCVNIHASLLPKYRGAAPIQHAILNGERETGVTAMYMAEELDSGDIINVMSTTIRENETAGELFDRLGDMGAELLSKTVSVIAAGTAERKAQRSDDISFAPPLSKEMSPIDWAANRDEILCKIRALNPWPVATALIDGVCLKVFSAEPGVASTTHLPGAIVSADNRGIEVACGNGAVMLTQIQAPGGKKMSAADYLRGHPICL